MIPHDPFDLRAHDPLGPGGAPDSRGATGSRPARRPLSPHPTLPKIGRASCRERV